MKYETHPILKIIAEKVIEPLICFFNFPLAYLAGKSRNVEKAILRPVMKSYTKHSNACIYQYTKLPKNVETMPVEWPDDGRFADCAIILQGPIRTEDHFTADTVRYYKRCYSGASIIVSTWPGSDQKTQEEIREAGAYWVENTPPEIPGAGNVNLQLISSLGGVNKAKSLGCKYAMKTRTDQRICSNDVLRYFRNLQEAFPSGDSNIVTNRLVYASGEYTYRYIPFHLCDFVVFGDTSELIKLYSIPLDKRPGDFNKRYAEEEWNVIKDIAEHLEIKDEGSPYEQISDFEGWYYRYMFAEIYIVYHYFQENIGDIKPGDDLLDAYYWYLKNYAIIADEEDLALYWPKYSSYATKKNSKMSTLGKMDFKKWQELYLHYQPKREWKMHGEEVHENERLSI